MCGRKIEIEREREMLQEIGEKDQERKIEDEFERERERELENLTIKHTSGRKFA